MTELEECLLGALWVAALLHHRQISRLRRDRRGRIVILEEGEGVWNAIADIEAVLGQPPRSRILG